MGWFGFGKKKKAEKRVCNDPARDFMARLNALEERAREAQSKPLPEPLEGYAKQVVSTFGRYKSEEWTSCKADLRKIGEKMNDQEKQMFVAFRAEYLAAEAFQKGRERLGDFSVRHLEFAWDGLGGWMK